MIFMARIDKDHMLMLDTKTDKTHCMHIDRNTAEEKSIIQIDSSTYMWHEDKQIGYIRLERIGDGSAWAWTTTFAIDELNGTLEPTPEARGHKALYFQEALACGHYLKYLAAQSAKEQQESNQSGQA